MRVITARAPAGTLIAKRAAATEAVVAIAFLHIDAAIIATCAAPMF